MLSISVGYNYYKILRIFYNTQPATVKLVYKYLALIRYLDK